jgi:N-sulfoglucosamine sulfohydrolase
VSQAAVSQCSRAKADGRVDVQVGPLAHPPSPGYGGTGARGYIGSAATCLGLLLTVAGAAPVDRPNILLITSEDNGAHLSCYGDPYVRTPHLDKLAGDGIRFVNAYVTQAGCSQSRASIFTGLYPHQNGQIGLATHGLRMYRKDTPNIFGELKRAGYTTGLIGKIHVNPESAFPLDYHNGLGGFSHRDVAKEATLARAFMQKARKPFLLMVNYKDAHRPFIKQQKGLPKKPLEPGEIEVLPQIGLDTPNLRRQTADYYNCMMRLDDGIGMLIQAVKDAGKWDNTLIVYLGDHGADILRGKRTSYEGGLKIPLIASWPGRMQRGQVRGDLVSTIDLMPTFLELAGITNPPKLPGRSLVPMLRGESPDWREHLYTEYHLHSGHNYYPQRTVRDGRYKLILNLMAGELNPGYAFTNDRFFDEGEIERVLATAPPHVRAAYARLKIAPEYELYDLDNDPWEFHDLVADPAYGDVLKRLKEELSEWRVRTEDPLLNPDNLSRLTSEVASRWTTGSYKKNMAWNYPEYLRGKRRPNVLFIASDDMRPDLGCYGDPVAKTPNLDRLASEGTVFTRAYCQQTVCSPSRTSLITGRRPDTTKVWDLHTHFRRALPDVVTLPQYFKQRGYHARSIGKIYHGQGAPSVDEPSWSEDPVLDHVAKKDAYLLAKNRTGRKAASWEVTDRPEREYIDGKVCDHALAALETLAKGVQPFFLAVGFRKPHLPFNAPRRYFDLYGVDEPAVAAQERGEGCPDIALHNFKELRGYTDIPKTGPVPPGRARELRRAYYAAISFTDHNVGRLLEKLDKLRLTDKTVVVFWGDHGFHLGEHGIWCKTSNFELDARVPLIFRVPGQKDRGTCNSLVEFVDIYPTLADVCGLEVPGGLEGVSLRPCLDDPDAAVKDAAYTQHPRPSYGKRTHMGYSVRNDRYRYTEWRDLKTGKIAARELYDHEDDAMEMSNVAGDARCAGTVERLATALRNGFSTYPGAAPKRSANVRK